MHGNEDRETRTVRDAMQFAVMSLLFRKRLYFEVLMRLNRKFSHDTESLSLEYDENGISLVINPLFFSSLDTVSREAYLEHQVLHLLFKHPLRRGEKKEHLFNYACDIAINQLITHFAPGAYAVIKGLFGDESEEKREAEYYYELLLNKEAEFEDLSTVDDHGLWETFKGAGHFEDAALEQEMQGHLDSLINESCRSAGNTVPGEISGTFFMDYREEPVQHKKSWQIFLYKYITRVRSLRSLRSVEVAVSKRRPHKKMGFPMPSLRAHPGRSLNLAVVVDNSGSISDESFARFMHEIHSLNARDVQCNVIFCDSSVGHVKEDYFQGTLHRPDRGGTHYRDGVFYNYRPGYSAELKRIFVSGLMSGGGGTCYVPGVEKALSLKPAPDCIVYFTDSYDDGKLTRPEVPLVFVLTQKRQGFYPWADTIMMD